MCGPYRGRHASSSAPAKAAARRWSVVAAKSALLSELRALQWEAHIALVEAVKLAGRSRPCPRTPAGPARCAQRIASRARAVGLWEGGVSTDSCPGERLVAAHLCWNAYQSLRADIDKAPQPPPRSARLRESPLKLCACGRRAAGLAVAGGLCCRCARGVRRCWVASVRLQGELLESAEAFCRHLADVFPTMAGEPSPGADVAGVSPVSAQMWAGAGPVPAQMWAGVRPVPVQMWQG